MKTDWYERAVRALCASAGIAEWKSVAAIKQIEAGGFPVAIFPERQDVPRLGLYVELTGHGIDDPALLRRLLEANIDCGGGCFCLVPGSGTLAYRMSVDGADQMSGDALLTRILDLVLHAEASLRGVLVQHTEAARAVPPDRARHAAWPPRLRQGARP